MIKTLEERKKEYLAYITEKYRSKQLPWWKSPPPECKTTREIAEGITRVPTSTTETIIKYDTKGALLHGALFFLLAGAVAAICYADNKLYSADCAMTLFFILLISFASFIQSGDHTPRIIISNTGIWFNRFNGVIEWQHVVETFIKKDASGDGISYDLVIHYYNTHSDSFTSTEMNVDNLDVDREAMAADIEYRKRITG